MAMMDDIREINKKVLNKSVNQGVAFAKRHTPCRSASEPCHLYHKTRKTCGKRSEF